MNQRDLIQLLPAIYRLRDQERAAHVAGLLTPAEEAEYAVLAATASPTLDQHSRRTELEDKLTTGPLRALLQVLAEPLAAFDENLDQLYDDLFIETCADWVIPYLGDLIGYRMLHGKGFAGSQRAEVAHTIAYRRRKGTASMLEQLARDVTGWNTHALEFFLKLATTSYLNHVRLDRPATADLRRWDLMERVETGFEGLAHSADLRSVALGRGKFNIPNVGVFLWAFDAYPLLRSPAVAVDAQRFLIHPLGIPTTLITRPEAEDDIAHLAEPINVPAPISRRVLRENLAHYYGVGRSLTLYIGGVPVPAASILSRHLGDDGAGWGHTPPPAGMVAVDPVLGRIALGDPLPARAGVEVSFHYAAPMAWGGGAYERAEGFPDIKNPQLEKVSSAGLPGTHATLQAALAAIGPAGGIVEIVDSGRYHVTAAQPLVIDVPAGQHIELRAANHHRPTVVLERAISVKGGKDATAGFNGLLLTGKAGQALVDGGNPIPGELIHVPAGSSGLSALRIAQCTLVPGRSLDPKGGAEHRDEPSIVFMRPDAQLALARTICGPLRVDPTSKVFLVDTMLDAVTLDRTVYAGMQDALSGGRLLATECTFKGQVRAVEIELLSNAICLSPVVAERRQHGCVRFSYLPVGSRVPRRHRCQPEVGGVPVAPRFASLQFGSPLYAWLYPTTPDVILRGADDEGEMGALHALFRPQREMNLRIRLEEYLRAGLEAGLFYEIWGLGAGDAS